MKLNIFLSVNLTPEEVAQVFKTGKLNVCTDKVSEIQEETTESIQQAAPEHPAKELVRNPGKTLRGKRGPYRKKGKLIPAPDKAVQEKKVETRELEKPSDEVFKAINKHPRYKFGGGEQDIIGGRRIMKKCRYCGADFRNGSLYQDGFCTFKCKRLFDEERAKEPINPVLAEIEERRKIREKSAVEF